jgi:site-specific DNA recombinase
MLEKGYVPGPAGGEVDGSTCDRRMESAWSNGKPAYRCRHGHTSAAAPDPGRARNAYVREDRLLPQLSALHLLLADVEPAAGRRRRTRRRIDARPQVSAEDAVGFLRERGITLTWNQFSRTLQATTEAAKTIIVKAS